MIERLEELRRIIKAAETEPANSAKFPELWNRRCRVLQTKTILTLIEIVKIQNKALGWSKSQLRWSLDKREYKLFVDAEEIYDEIKKSLAQVRAIIEGIE